LAIFLASEEAITNSKIDKKSGFIFLNIFGGTMLFFSCHTMFHFIYLDRMIMEVLNIIKSVLFHFAQKNQILQGKKSLGVEGKKTDTLFTNVFLFFLMIVLPRKLK